MPEDCTCFLFGDFFQLGNLLSLVYGGGRYDEVFLCAGGFDAIYDHSTVCWASCLKSRMTILKRPIQKRIQQTTLKKYTNSGTTLRKGEYLGRELPCHSPRFQ